MFNRDEITTLIEEDKWMMEILNATKSLNLPDWWVCAGFVRSKIWDVLHEFSVRTPIPDIDVIYFDAADLGELAEKKLEDQLRTLLPNIPWSVKNEARMHLRNNVEPYSSSVDAMSKFPETATALGVKLDERNKVILAAPCGISDAVHLEVKPTPYFRNNQNLAPIYNERILKKNWQARWNKLRIHEL
ncbi:nucleotidyltransferase family protein [Bacillus suaedae]|uniref:Nucleotidyltransferase family protein n=1 Tax=Halalkalibacter suaedae TaxID=2822140 RepID=A0A941AMV7_9BACI|nr:nucleotidyltransferase family protein [Bacillus suaedae]MBP3950246.1 nucleotidyltransferase family protein [Bacillus suaedae]